MDAVFVVCSTIGGTLLVAQLVLNLLGLGHGELDHDFSGDVGHDLGGHDVAQNDTAQHDAGGSSDQTDNNSAATQAAAHQGSTLFFSILSFRTLVAAIAFFGLAGLAAEHAGLDAPQPLLIALASGAAAMYGVYYLMQSLGRLRSDGTERIGSAVGLEAKVYLSIPAERSGRGKVHLTLQNRLVECEALTAGPALATGTRVIVVSITGPSAVEVSAIDAGPSRVADRHDRQPAVLRHG